MTNEALQAKITELLPTAAFEEGAQWVTVNIAPEELHPLAVQLRQDPSLQFDFLFCLTCVDWKTNLSMVYHLDSTTFRHNLVIKSKLAVDKPEIETVCDIWKTADFHEREVYEMFGVNFINHPDLRLLILPDGWEGKNPLLKNFEDPINMIRL